MCYNILTIKRELGVNVLSFSLTGSVGNTRDSEKHYSLDLSVDPSVGDGGIFGNMLKII